jgi:hypothetical protein
MSEALESISSTTKINLKEKKKKPQGNQTRWYAPVIPALRKLRQED